MSDLLWPTLLVPFQSRLDVIDAAGRFVSPLSGFARAVGRPGTRMRYTMGFRALTGNKARAYRSIVSAIRGYNPVYVHDHSYEQAGSFSGAELLSNTTFADGTTGWSPGSFYTHTAEEYSIRSARNTVGPGSLIRNSSPVTVTAFVPYVVRGLCEPGRGTFSSLQARAGSTAGGAEYGSTAYTEPGFLTHAFVPYGTSIYASLRDTADSGGLAGDFVHIPFMSLTRCALVDNGANYLLYSSDLTKTVTTASPQQAVWTPTRASVLGTSITLPDGTTGTANSLHEDTTSGNTHYLSQNVTVAATADVDFCFAVAIHAANRTWARVGMVEQTGSTVVATYINLSTGALSSSATGANWADLRTSVVSLGDSWWYVSVVARKTNTATTLTARVWAAEGDNDITFDGLDQNSVRLWRPSLAQSSVPMRLTATTTTAYSTGQSQNLGGGIYTKGWPASTDNLLKRGDQVQIGNQLMILDGPVNSDAAGLATLPIGTLRVAPSDGAPVIITRPMGRFLIEQNENGWAIDTNLHSSGELVLSEAS